MSPGSNIGTAPTTPGPAAIVVAAVAAGVFDVVVVVPIEAGSGDADPFISVADDGTVRREGSIVEPGLGPAMLAMALLLLGFPSLVLLSSSSFSFFSLLMLQLLLQLLFPLVLDVVVVDVVAA